MPIAIKIDDDQSLCVARSTGLLTIQEMIDEFSLVLAETQGAAFHKHMLFIFNETVSLNHIDLSSLLKLKAQLECWNEIYPGRNVHTALVSNDRLHRALLKLWGAITELYPQIGAFVQVFEHEAEAISWLREKPDQARCG